MSQEDARPRLRELDGLRGLAALGVVLSHLTTTFDETHPGRPAPAFRFAEGGYGVQLFFLISGFVILMTARRARRPSDFVIARLSRLYPVYWIALSLTTLLLLLFAAPSAAPRLGVFLANLTMVQRWLLVENIDPVYWTLAVEMQFYALILLLLVATRARLNTRLLLGVALTWIVLSVVVAMIASPHSQGIAANAVATPWKILLNLTLAEYGPLFMAGCLAYLARLGEGRWGWSGVAAASAVIVAALLHSPKAALIVAGISAVFLLVVARPRTRILLWRPIQWLGLVSYSLYVFHTVPTALVTDSLIPHIGRNAAMAGALLTAFVTAGVLHRLGEVQGTRLLRTLLIKAQRRCIRQVPQTGDNPESAPAG